MFKLILLILLFGFILISSKTRYMIGTSLRQTSTFILWTVKFEEREKNGLGINQVGYKAKNLIYIIK